jgi:LysR family transcriptional regulator, regulator for bpeEF and oprC
MQNPVLAFALCGCGQTREGPLDKLRALQYFVAAAEEGSFAGAARRLEVSVPSVHKLLSSLEVKLGVRLLDRTTRGLTLTASGEAYLESCRPLLEELAAVDAAVSRSAENPSGILVIGAPSQLAIHFLLPALPRFHAKYHDIQIDIRVVHPSDPDAGAVDVFLIHGWPEANDLVHRRLGQARAVICATPEYWASRGIPRHPQELEQHACMLVRNPAGILIDLWEFERGGDKVSVKVGGWLCSNDREVVLAAVLAGEGVARFSEASTRSQLQSGRLVPVLPDWEVQGGPPLNLLYRASNRRTPRVRLLLDFIVGLVQQFEAEGTAGAPRAGIELPQWHRKGYGRASSVLRWRG